MRVQCENYLDTLMKARKGGSAKGGITATKAARQAKLITTLQAKLSSNAESNAILAALVDTRLHQSTFEMLQ